MRIRVLVQHHPYRASMLAALLSRLPGDTIVVSDPEPDSFASAWRTYEACLEAASDVLGLTHACILQDDVTLCRNFPAVLERVVAAQPDRLICLFHGGQPRENLLQLTWAQDQGRTLVKFDTFRWVPVVALVWPVRLVCPTVCWVAEQNWPQRFRADDEIVGRAIRHLREPILVTVPSLVEHEDVVPSLIGRRAMAGGDLGRVAHLWIGDRDPLDLDWTAGPL